MLRFMFKLSVSHYPAISLLQRSHLAWLLR